MLFLKIFRFLVLHVYKNGSGIVVISTAAAQQSTQREYAAVGGAISYSAVLCVCARASVS